MSVFLYFFICFKPHADPTIINGDIKEIHILIVGGIPGISQFKSCASLSCSIPLLQFGMEMDSTWSEHLYGHVPVSCASPVSVLLHQQGDEQSLPHWLVGQSTTIVWDRTR